MGTRGSLVRPTLGVACAALPAAIARAATAPLKGGGSVWTGAGDVPRWGVAGGCFTGRPPALAAPAELERMRSAAAAARFWAASAASARLGTAAGAAGAGL